VENFDDFKICVDQGFPRSGDLLKKFFGPISRRSRQNIFLVFEQFFKKKWKSTSVLNSSKREKMIKKRSYTPEVLRNNSKKGNLAHRTA